MSDTQPGHRAAADALLVARDEVATLPAPGGLVRLDDVLGTLRDEVDAHTPPFTR